MEMVPLACTTRCVFNVQFSLLARKLVIYRGRQLAQTLPEIDSSFREELGRGTLHKCRREDRTCVRLMGPQWPDGDGAGDGDIIAFCTLKKKLNFVGRKLLVELQMRLWWPEAQTSEACTSINPT